MVVLGVGDVRDGIDEAHRLAEVLELELPGDRVFVGGDLPAGQFREVRLHLGRLHGRSSLGDLLTRSFCERGHRLLLWEEWLRTTITKAGVKQSR